ncbi:MAG: hypothetical protein LC645_00135 [Geobacteraceae bacterium]|nr:hypothetical protein [Geobacteraceae bacterium]
MKKTINKLNAGGVYIAALRAALRFHPLRAQALTLICVTFMCLCAAGCTSTPTEEHIKVQIARHILPQAGEEIFYLENFQKLDARLNADKSYSVEVSYDLVFRKSLDEISAQLSSDARRSPFEAMDKGLEILAKVIEFGNFKAGDRIHKREIYRFVKTEKSWRLATEFSPEPQQ